MRNLTVYINCIM